jgi:molecular chaperone GrpE
MSEQEKENMKANDNAGAPLPEEEKIREDDVESREEVVNPKQEQSAEEAARIMEDDLVDAQREAKESYDRFLRVHAEFENYKKRMEKERSELIKYANEGLIKQLLEVMDNLERALDQAEQNAHAEGLVEGVKMILKQMRDILGKHGVSEVEALGKSFDPNLHEAMMHELADDEEENTVIDEFQKGYILKDRLLRPALVKVSKKSENKVDAGPSEE